MNLEDQILAEHSKSNTEYIVSYINNDERKFRQLMDLFFNGSYSVVQRASWIMATCANKNPGLIHPYLKKLVDDLPKKHKHQAVKRHTLQIFENVEIPELYHGPIISMCFDFLTDRKEAVAAKAYAMTIIYKLTKNEPDLQKELRLIIEDQIDFSSPAFTSRGSKILKALAK